MNYTIEISRASIYNACDNNKYNSCPELLSQAQVLHSLNWNSKGVLIYILAFI
jgi:hypothetical protein